MILANLEFLRPAEMRPHYEKVPLVIKTVIGTYLLGFCCANEYWTQDGASRISHNVVKAFLPLERWPNKQTDNLPF